MAKFNLPFGLNIAAPDPTDTRQQAANQTAREAYVTGGLSYEGMIVYQEDNDTPYILKGLTNSDWEELGKAITAGNGIVNNSGVFDWGGTLTSSISIDKGGKAIQFQGEGNLSFDSKEVGNSDRFCRYATSGMELNISSNIIGIGSVTMTMGTGGLVFHDTIYNKGAVYISDYSNAFTPNSLISKKYADSRINGKTTTVIDALNTNTGPGAIEDGQVLTWDNASGEFVLSVNSNVAAGNGITDNAGTFDLGGSLSSDVDLISNNSARYFYIEHFGGNDYLFSEKNSFQAVVNDGDNSFILNSTGSESNIDNGAGSVGNSTVTALSANLSVSSATWNSHLTMQDNIADLYINNGAGSTTGMSIHSVNGWMMTDQITSKGMVYAADYSAVGTLDDRWIPDYAAVKAYADSVGLNSISFNTADGVLTLGLADGSNLTQDLDGRYFLGISTLTSQWDTYDPPATGELVHSNGTTNPLGTTTLGGIWLPISDLYGTVLGGRFDDDASHYSHHHMHFRHYENGVWQDWRELIHDDNIGEYLDNYKPYRLFQPDGTNPFVYTENTATLNIDGTTIIGNTTDTGSTTITSNAGTGGRIEMTDFLGDSWVRLSSYNESGVLGFIVGGLFGVGTFNPKAMLQANNSASTEQPALGASSAYTFGVSNGNVGTFMGVNAAGNTWIQGQYTNGTATAKDIIFQANGGSIGIGKTPSLGTLDVNGTGYFSNTLTATSFTATSLPVYANNAAALVGGLTAGQFYKTAATGDAQVMVVNAT